MTLDEMEKFLGELADHMKQIQDAQTVQGVFEHRIEGQIEFLATAAELTNRAAQTTHRAVEKLVEIVAKHEDRLAGVEDDMATLRDGMATMQSAMTALFDRMDRFIRGLESNGHEKGTR